MTRESIILPLHEPPDMASAIAEVARGASPAILESAETGAARGRYTILTCDPLVVRAWHPGDGDPFGGIRETLRQTPVLSEAANHLPFQGGWIGFFAYEAGHLLEPVAGRLQPARRDIPLPLGRFALYDWAAIHDGWTGAWSLVGADLGEMGLDTGTRSPFRSRLAGWAERLRDARRPPPSPAAAVSPAGENMTQPQYLQMVERARAYIAAGDIFQVNLARRETWRVAEPPLSTYLRLRQVNPAGYAAYLGWNEPDGRNTAILSASPELFLDVRGREVVTRPIKGTRPRSVDPVLDAALQAELLESHKDRAELAMIVDLERNDLGRVCEYGSVRVVGMETGQPYQLETHPTVHHLVSTVSGRLRRECDAIDLLRATFPGGSITGAPKIRAMQIIQELEPTDRSVYTGSIGYFGLNGTASFNIAIRTLICTGDLAHIYAGGGIVADSVPEDEYRETQAKALGLRRALGVSTATNELHASILRPDQRGSVA